MHPVVFECLENAQAMRRQLAETRDDMPDGYLGERLHCMEKMLTYLLAGLDYLARNDDPKERPVLWDTLYENEIKGIGPDPRKPWPKDGE